MELPTNDLKFSVGLFEWSVGYLSGDIPSDAKTLAVYLKTL